MTMEACHAISPRRSVANAQFAAQQDAVLQGSFFSRARARRVKQHLHGGQSHLVLVRTSFRTPWLLDASGTHNLFIALPIQYSRAK